MARQLPGDLQERAESAKHAAEKARARAGALLQRMESESQRSCILQVALDTGFTQATADQEGDRAKRLVLEHGEAWEVRMFSFSQI